MDIIGDLALTVHDFPSAAQAVVDFMHHRYRLDAVAVCRRDGDDYFILSRTPSEGGLQPGVVVPWESTLCARAADGRIPRVIPRMTEELARAGNLHILLDRLPGAFVSFPLMARSGTVLGTLCAAAGDPREAELDSAQGVIELCAGLLGSLLEKELESEHESRRADYLPAPVETDEVTRLGTRRFWERVLLAEDARCAKYGISASILIVDLDDFREINRTRGHIAGDGMLRATARCLQGAIRSIDSVARLGGDEFGVLAVECGGAAAPEVARRISGALERAGIPAAVGFATRVRDQSLVATWRSAVEAMEAARANQPVSTSRLPTARVQKPILLEGAADHAVTNLLRYAREQLGMSVGFISQFVGDQRVMRHVDSSMAIPLSRGDSEELSTTYCERVVDGRMPHVIPDTSRNAEARELPITARYGIGRYIGVPITFEDGRLYGTICCLDFTADETLNDRDVAFLRVIAASVATHLQQEEQDAERRYEIIDRIDRVVADGGPKLVFQPIIELGTGELASAEVLSRFPPEHARTPDVWFADAVSVGSGVHLDMAVLTQVAVLMASVPGRLSVNLSGETVCSPELAGMLDKLPVDRLILEITEHDVIESYEQVRAALAPFRARGLRLAVDDAGAGFASLRHILQLQPDIIKLDISLVRGIATDPVRQALAASLTAFADRTGARVVAEGIEEADELAVLNDLGVTFGQGYHIDRPLPWSAFQEKWGCSA